MISWSMTQSVNGFRDLLAPLAALVLDYCHEEPKFKTRDLILRDVDHDRRIVNVKFAYWKIAEIFEKAIVDVPVVDYFGRLSPASLKLPTLRAFAVTTFVYKETMLNVAGKTCFRLNLTVLAKKEARECQYCLRIDECFKALGIKVNPQHSLQEKEIQASDLTSINHEEGFSCGGPG